MHTVTSHQDVSESRSALDRRDFLRRCAAGAAALSSPLAFSQPLNGRQPPNVVFILSDDVGYGDVGCYGATVVKTPHIDNLATQGLRFTDAHSDAATCTPSRYSILAGDYAWRRPGAHILPGDASLLLDPAKPSLASIFKNAGYSTGCVGKWHLGLGNGSIDWNGSIAPGPREVGFDYSFIIPATADRVPCVYLENGRVVGLNPKDPITVSYQEKVGSDPTGHEHPEMLTKMKLSHGHDGTIVDGVSRIGYMSGGHSARWVDEQMAPTITQKAVSYIEGNRSRPFFLYFATSDIHVPRMPDKEFANTSACGRRCDAIEQLDWSVGQIMATLERLGLRENTLLIFSSDNGPVVDDGYADGSVEHLDGHKPAGALRGGKYSIYEGGTRVPFITSWPGTIQPGVSNALVGQVDLLASCSALLGKIVPAMGTDSRNVLPALLGHSKKGRDVLVEEANVLAIRKDQWKLIDRGKKAGASSFELYDLSKDLGEQHNLASAQPKLVQQLASELDRIRS